MRADPLAYLRIALDTDIAAAFLEGSRQSYVFMSPNKARATRA